MKTTTTSAAALTSQGTLTSAVAGAWETVCQSFDQFAHQAAAVFKGSAIFIGAMIGGPGQEVPGDPKPWAP